mmetsp:Transcript_81022/g.181171  ORF Transcript_81022/g.181171 Transcript_81022/m.181171 type:complete len:224 (+) Transcript_81022:761-1432(+)
MAPSPSGPPRGESRAWARQPRATCEPIPPRSPQRCGHARCLRRRQAEAPRAPRAARRGQASCLQLLPGQALAAVPGPAAPLASPRLASAAPRSMTPARARDPPKRRPHLSPSGAGRCPAPSPHESHSVAVALRPAAVRRGTPGLHRACRCLALVGMRQAWRTASGSAAAPESGRATPAEVLACQAMAMRVGTGRRPHGMGRPPCLTWEAAAAAATAVASPNCA